jgi:hypothetical protein
MILVAAAPARAEPAPTIAVLAGALKTALKTRSTTAASASGSADQW